MTTASLRKKTKEESKNLDVDRNRKQVKGVNNNQEEKSSKKNKKNSLMDESSSSRSSNPSSATSTPTKNKSKSVSQGPLVVETSVQENNEKVSSHLTNEDDQVQGETSNTTSNIKREETDENECQKQQVKPSPRHGLTSISMPHVQLLNLTYTALTATSVKLKWNLVSGSDPHSEQQHQILLVLQRKASSSGGLFCQHFRVEMIQGNQEKHSIDKTTEESDATKTSDSLNQVSPVDDKNVSVRNVFQGSSNTCRVSHLTCGQQYSFRVRTFIDSCYCVVSNLLTITTPDQSLTKSKKSGGKASSFNANSLVSSSSSASCCTPSQTDSKKTPNRTATTFEDDDSLVEFEKKDKRRAAMILMIFTMSALMIAILIQQFFGLTIPDSNVVSVVPSAPLPPPVLPQPPV